MFKILGEVKCGFFQDEEGWHSQPFFSKERGIAIIRKSEKSGFASPKEVKSLSARISKSALPKKPRKGDKMMGKLFALLGEESRARSYPKELAIMIVQAITMEQTADQIVSVLQHVSQCDN